MRSRSTRRSIARIAARLTSAGPRRVPEDFRVRGEDTAAITHERAPRRPRGGCRRVSRRSRRARRQARAAAGATSAQLRVRRGMSPAFFSALRARHDGAVACEPRHASWFRRAPQSLLDEHRIARVAADPALVPAAPSPAAGAGLRYFRLHGAPRVYYSEYAPRHRAPAAAHDGARLVHLRQHRARRRDRECARSHKLAELI